MFARSLSLVLTLSSADSADDCGSLAVVIFAKFNSEIGAESKVCCGFLKAALTFLCFLQHATKEFATLLGKDFSGALGGAC